MLAKPSRTKIRVAWGIAVVSVSTLLMLIASTWLYAFVPSAWLAESRTVIWILFGIGLLTFASIRSSRLKRRNFKVPDKGILVIGAVLFSWALREAAFGLLMIINLYALGPEETIFLNVVDNKFYQQGRIKKNVLTATIKDDGDVVRRIEYRRSQVDFSSVSGGDSMSLNVVPGLVGYRIVRHDKRDQMRSR